MVRTPAANKGPSAAAPKNTIQNSTVRCWIFVQAPTKDLLQRGRHPVIYNIKLDRKTSHTNWQSYCKPAEASSSIAKYNRKLTCQT